MLVDALGPEELAHSVDLQGAALAKRLDVRRITLDVSPAAREWLALTGWDPAYGARPLRRLVQQSIGDRLARALLGGGIRGGRHRKSDDGRGGEAGWCRGWTVGWGDSGPGAAAGAPVAGRGGCGWVTGRSVVAWGVAGGGSGRGAMCCS